MNDAANYQSITVTSTYSWYVFHRKVWLIEFIKQSVHEYNWTNNRGTIMVRYDCTKQNDPSQ